MTKKNSHPGCIQSTRPNIAHKPVRIAKCTPLEHPSSTSIKTETSPASAPKTPCLHSYPPHRVHACTLLPSWQGYRSIRAISMRHKPSQAIHVLRNCRFTWFSAVEHTRSPDQPTSITRKQTVNKQSDRSLKPILALATNDDTKTQDLLQKSGVRLPSTG